MGSEVPQEFLVVVGARHYSNNIKELICSNNNGLLKYDCTATIRHEKDNQFDPNAIEVNVQNRTVGYISKFRSTAVIALIGSDEVELNCTLLWNGDPEEDYSMYTVQLFE
jgi:hypothetical protein